MSYLVSHWSLYHKSIPSKQIWTLSTRSSLLSFLPPSSSRRTNSTQSIYYIKVTRKWQITWNKLSFWCIDALARWFILFLFWSCWSCKWHIGAIYAPFLRRHASLIVTLLEWRYVESQSLASESIHLFFLLETASKATHTRMHTLRHLEVYRICLIIFQFT